MNDKKTIFVAFAIEDSNQWDLLKRQTLHTDSSYEYIDISIEEAYDSEWNKRVKVRIHRSDDVIVLISKTSLR